MKVLIVAPIECFPDYYGNSARIASFVRFLEQEGIDFRYLHLPNRSFDPQKMLEKLGHRYIYQDYRPQKQVIRRLRYRALHSLLTLKRYRMVKVDDFIQSSDIKQYKRILLSYQPSVVIINYTYLSKLLSYTPPGILKMIDTHDSLHLRFKSLYNDKKAINRFRITVRDEINALNRADKVICIQDQEHDFFEQNGCKAQLYTIGHHITYQPTAHRQARYKLLYLGAAYEANLDAITYFLEQVWPTVIRHYPHCQLYIAGGIGQQLLSSGKKYPAVTLSGYVQDLAQLYETIDVAINPVRMGSGMKIKNIEALSFGKPVITTTIGAEGLHRFTEKGMLVAADLTDWLTAIERLLTDTVYYRHILKEMKEELLAYNNTNQEQMRQLLVPLT